ncbi:sulfur oxidation c-type cytochrome SoxX [Caenispirillum salinarum]|uniref:sulfur oxidation c-type cytochrome SoxX n=1 Tax=Caenispirillum salinarum TaxID=859058 RepID=UPI0038508502
MQRKTSAISAMVATAAVAGLALAAPAQAADLVDYKVVDDWTIPESLTGQPGDPVNGKVVAVDRKLGNCLSCHKMPVPEEQFHGETGPSLWGVGNRYEPEHLRLRLVDSKVINPETMMPAFYRVEGLHMVKDSFEGEPILTAQQVEDVVAYLVTLTEEEPQTN